MLDQLAFGAFSGVFDLGDGQVLKVFKRGGPSRHPEKCTGMISFEAEVRAYERLQQHPDLEVFVPRFFGAAKAKPTEVPEEDFLLDCAIRLERIPGEDVKIAHLPHDLLDEADRMLEEMKRRMGLDDPWDASCFVPGTRARFTLIDFATPSEDF